MNKKLGYTKVCNHPEPQPPKNYLKKPKLVSNSYVTAV